MLLGSSRQMLGTKGAMCEIELELGKSIIKVDCQKNRNVIAKIREQYYSILCGADGNVVNVGHLLSTMLYGRRQMRARYLTGLGNLHVPVAARLLRRWLV